MSISPTWLRPIALFSPLYELAGIDRLLDGDDGGAAFLRPAADQQLVTLGERLVVQPEDARAQPPRLARGGVGMGDDVAALDEQFAVERDADRAARALPARDRRHRPALDRLDLGDLAGRHDHDLVAGNQAAGFDAAGDDAAIVELVDRLHRQTQRQRFQRPRRLEPIKRLDHGRALVPADAVGALGDAVAVARGNRDHSRGLHAEALQMRRDLVADFLEALGGEIDAVHLVDDDRDLLHAEQMQQIAVTAGLVAHAFERVDDQHRAVGLRGAGDHVAQEFGVAGRVDQHDVARIGAEADLRGVDGDALVALGLQRVEQERPFERHAAPRADGLQHLELAVRQAAGFVQQAADQRRLAVVDMADDDDADLRSRRAVRRGGRSGGDDHVHIALASLIRDSRRRGGARKRPRSRGRARGRRAPAPWSARARSGSRRCSLLSKRPDW